MRNTLILIFLFVIIGCTNNKRSSEVAVKACEAYKIADFTALKTVSSENFALTILSRNEDRFKSKGEEWVKSVIDITSAIDCSIKSASFEDKLDSMTFTFMSSDRKEGVIFVLKDKKGKWLVTNLQKIRH